MGKQVQNLTIKFILVGAISAMYVLLCSGCYTKKRALKKFCKPVPVQIQFDTIIKFVATTPGDSGEVSLPCEEFKALYDSLLKAGSNKIDSNGYKTIFENKKTKLKAKPNQNGAISLNVVDKGDTAKAEVPIKIIKEAPCNCPEPDLTFLQWFDQQGFFLQIGFILIFISALLFVAQVILSWLNRQASA